MHRLSACLATTAALVVAVSGLASCGSHRTASAPTTVAPVAVSISATTSTSSTTSTTVRTVARTRPPRHRGPWLAPLTGLPTTARVARRSAVVLKIDNLDEALPQTGPNQADVVYEEMVEGGLTRLAAVFQSDDPAVAGPVRSGRLTDEGIADDLHHPVLAYAGANAIFQPALEAQPVRVVDDTTSPDLFVVDDSREAPHNLYTDIGRLAAMDPSHTPPPALWPFRPAGTGLAGEGVRPASSVTVRFPAALIQWTWNAPRHRWLRTQNGIPDVDAAGVRLDASNVIVQVIPYVTSAYVSGEGPGADGAPIPHGKMVGSGPAWYLSGGAVVKGTWSRSSITSPTVYRGAGGDPIRLAPGRTWVELAEAGTTTVPRG